MTNYDCDGNTCFSNFNVLTFRLGGATVAPPRRKVKIPKIINDVYIRKTRSKFWGERLGGDMRGAPPPSNK